MGKKRESTASARSKAGSRKKKKQAEPASQGLSPSEMVAGSPPSQLEKLSLAIQQRGGRVLGTYREPLGAHWQLLASLPIDQVLPTPFQRDLSETHVARLADIIQRTGRYLDPVIAVQSPEGSFWTPNGHHRLAAMQRLGARSIVALVVAEPEVAYQILALNTEKAHNLRERSLEAVRMARSLAELDPRPEEDFALEFEEAALLTLGVGYEQRGRFSGGTYHPVLRRVDQFLSWPLPKALETRERRAARLLELDDKVSQAVAALKQRGLASPYLRAFVVARLNPLRFKRGAKMSFDEAIDAMLKAAGRFDPDKVQISDLAGAAGPPGED